MKNATCRSSTRSLQKEKRIYHGPKLGATNLEAGLPILVLWPRFLGPESGPCFVATKHKQKHKQELLNTRSKCATAAASWQQHISVILHICRHMYIYICMYILCKIYCWSLLYLSISSIYDFPPKTTASRLTVVLPTCSQNLESFCAPSRTKFFTALRECSSNSRSTDWMPLTTGALSGRSMLWTFNLQHIKKKRATVVQTQSLGIGYGIWHTQKNYGDVMLKWWFNH